MREKDRLISIGKLSKITGVHIRCLRYYEELGILIPAYTDPKSKYRYYSFAQMRIVEAIQYCVELDIPLKQFADFWADGGEQINYTRLLAYGENQVKEKIKKMNAKLALLKSIQSDMEHGESCRSDQIVCSYLPAKTVWLSPYTGVQTEKSFLSAAYSIMDEVCEHGLTPGCDIGLLSIYQNETVKSFVYITLAGVGTPQKYPQIFELPAGNYYCTVTQQTQIHEAPTIFQKQFEDERDKIVVETELFTGDYHFYEPQCELRCHLIDP